MFIHHPALGRSSRASSFAVPSRRFVRLSILACLGLLGLASAAEAATMAAGALFGSPAQTRGVCYVYNSGTAPVTLSNFRITTQSGAAFALVVNECGTFPVALAAGRSCGIAINANNQAFNCAVEVSPSKSTMRGVFEMRNSSGVVLQNVPMR